MTELPARMGERFTLAELLGRGTCSTVYRARDELLDRDVAVKIFPVTDDPRVAREVHLLASMDHPALVPVYDLGEVDGRAFVVMALFEGGDLADRLAAGGPLPVDQALLTSAAVADALAHVHRAGVLHRDVIPRNVLFDADGRAHLSDFGVALVADAPRITDTGIVVGSAPYLAPEQVRGDEVGPAADVYSLGLVLLESLTGRRAYEGAPLEAAQARLEHAPAIPRDVPDDVAVLIGRMTADDPDARPDAETVCRDLRRAALARELTADDPRTMAAAPVGVPTTDLTERPATSLPSRTVRRGTLVLGAASLSILLASGVVIAATGPVDSVSATTPPGAGLAAPMLVVPAPGPDGLGGGDPDDSSGTSDDSSGDDEPSDAARRDGSTGSGRIAREARAAAGSDDRGSSSERPGDTARDDAPRRPARTEAPTTTTPRPTTTSPTTTSPTTTTSPETTTPTTGSSSTSPTTSSGDEDAPGRGDDETGDRDGDRSRDDDRTEGRDGDRTDGRGDGAGDGSGQGSGDRSRGDDGEDVSSGARPTGLLEALGDPAGGLLGS